MHGTGKRKRIVLVHVRLDFYQGLLLREEIILECKRRDLGGAAAHTLDGRLRSWIEANGFIINRYEIIIHTAI